MTAAMAVKFVKSSDPVHAASHQSRHCNLCFDVFSADHTLEIAASALLSPTLLYCCGSPKFSCSAVQICWTARQHWLLSRHCSAAWTITGTGRRIRLYAWRYNHASMNLKASKPNKGHAFLVYVQELMQSTVFYGTHRHLFP